MFQDKPKVTKGKKISEQDWAIASPVESAEELLAELLEKENMGKEYLNAAKKLQTYRNLMTKLKNKKNGEIIESIYYIDEIKKIVEFCKENKGSGILGIGL